MDLLSIQTNFIQKASLAGLLRQRESDSQEHYHIPSCIIVREVDSGDSDSSGDKALFLTSPEKEYLSALRSTEGPYLIQPHAAPTVTGKHTAHPSARVFGISANFMLMGPNLRPHSHWEQIL